MNIETYLSRAIPVEPWLKKFFDAGDRLVMFDIGACEGEESIRYARLFPSAIVYSFEPLPNNYQLARANFLKFGKEAAHLFNIALGDENGETNFFVSSGQPDHATASSEWNYGNKSGSILPPGEMTAHTYQWLKFEEGDKVTVRRLEDFCREQGIAHIHYVHMDVQGAELKVLDGAGQLLRNTDIVWMEVSTKEFYKGQPLEKEVFRYMRERGFILVYNYKEGSYGDHLYASDTFFKERGSKLDVFTRLKIRWLNVAGI